MNILFYFISFLFSLLFFDKNTVNREYRDYNISSDTLLFPKAKHREQSKLIFQLLSKYHYKKVTVDDSLSVKILEKYIESLDPNREYFYKSDIEYFNQYKMQMDDYIISGYLEPAYEIFTVYHQRVKDRISFVFSMLEKEPDFSVKEFLYFDRKKLDWFDDLNQMDNYWRKKIKNAILNLKILGKEWESNKDVLNKRYERYKKTISQFNSEDVFEIFINSYSELYDPHTNYFSPINADRFEITMSKTFEGIGARLQQDVEYTTIYQIMPGGPAYRNKELEKGDRIIGVAQGDDGDFEDIIGWRLDDVVNKIKGPKESVVRLLVLKKESQIDDYPDTVRLIRDRVDVVDEDATFDVVPFNTNNRLFNIGIIKIPSFYVNFEEAQKGFQNYKSVTRDVKKCIDSLINYSVDGIIIDLRNNGGGSLQEAIDLTGLFIETGPVVQIKSSSGRIEIEKDFDKRIHYNGPLLVLNNSFTASSSEIFSGALKDYNRGLIVGESTFGKGTVQNLLDLDRFFPKSDLKFGQLKITLAKYYRINGGSTQKIGVKPHVLFPNIYDRDIYTENSRKNALEWDRIRDISFNNKDYISQPLVDHLNSQFLQDSKSDSSLINYLSYVSKTEENRKKNKISLNYETRINEKKVNDSKSNSLETSIKISEIFPIEEEKLLDKIKSDVYLRESVKLFVEMINFKES
ncbi:MAG: carboxy terminal-processing peptidase [Bacteroidota bacterium]|nr:carboxy terminal-processing peptidase [Bacteroidota bacterium]